MYYDDLGRQVATIENQTGTAAIVWNQTLGRWELVNASHEDVDENRAVSVVYTLTAHKVEQLAHRLDDMDEDEPQITTYLSSYDDRVSAQELFPGHGVVRRIVYPDVEIAPEDHSVAMAYNRLGQVRYTVDQNGTEHAFTRDAMGRVTADTATVAYGSNIDSSIVKIAVSYDGFGRPSSPHQPTRGGTPPLNSPQQPPAPPWLVATPPARTKPPRIAATNHKNTPQTHNLATRNPPPLAA